MKEFDWARLKPLTVKAADNKRITGLIESCVKEVRGCEYKGLLHTMEEAFVPCYLYMATNSGFKPDDGYHVAMLAAYIIVYGWEDFVQTISTTRIFERKI